MTTSKRAKGSARLQPDSTEHLRSILAEIDALVSLRDRDRLLGHAIEFAREKLGIERCSIHYSHSGATLVRLGRRGWTVATAIAKAGRTLIEVRM
jgi:hypothetical protein